LNQEIENGFSTPKNKEENSEESVASPEHKPKNTRRRKNKSSLKNFSKELLPSQSEEEIINTTKKNKQEDERNKPELTKENTYKSSISDRVRTRKARLDMPEPEKQTKISEIKGKRKPRKHGLESE